MSTLVHGGDIFGVPSPTQMVADCRQLGFAYLGGYAYDDDVLSGNPWTQAHAQALVNAQIGFLPILTLRDSTLLGPSGAVAALHALVGGYIGPYGIDREPTAEPSQATVTAILNACDAAGFGPSVGYRYPWSAAEAWYAAATGSLWAAIPGGSSTPPQGAQHVQYGQQNGYDINTFNLDYLGMAPPPPPPPQESEPVTVAFTLPDGTLGTLELIPSSNQVAYTRTDPINFNVLNRQILDGRWLSIESQGVYQKELFMRGTGTDGKLYQSTLDLTQLATAKWVENPNPLA